jgi:hypothetical protein
MRCLRSPESTSRVPTVHLPVLWLLGMPVPVFEVTAQLRVEPETLGRSGIGVERTAMCAAFEVAAGPDSTVIGTVIYCHTFA